MWDPNTWGQEEIAYRIYGGLPGCSDVGNVQYCAIVDEIDYFWAIQWRWFMKFGKSKKPSYLFRSVHPIGDSFSAYSWYLHVEIMKRTGIKPPNWRHDQVDHIDGDKLNCKRDNLEWVTQKENLRRSIARQRLLRA